MHLEDLVAIWEKHPEQIVFHPRIPGCGARGAPPGHDIGYYEDEPDTMSDGERQLEAPWDYPPLLEHEMYPAYDQPIGHPFMGSGFAPRRRRLLGG